MVAVKTLNKPVEVLSRCLLGQMSKTIRSTAKRLEEFPMGSASYTVLANDSYDGGRFRSYGRKFAGR